MEGSSADKVSKTNPVLLVQISTMYSDTVHVVGTTLHIDGTTVCVESTVTEAVLKSTKSTDT